MEADLYVKSVEPFDWSQVVAWGTEEKTVLMVIIIKMLKERLHRGLVHVRKHLKMIKVLKTLI